MNSLTARLLTTALILLFAFPVASFADDDTLTRKSAVFAKLKIKLPEIKLNNTTMEEAIEFLRLRSIELDTEINDQKKGLNFLFAQANDGPQIKDSIIDRLDAHDMSILEILNLVCLKTETQYHVDEFAIAILPIVPEKSKDSSPEFKMIQRRWTTPPNFLDYITSPAGKLARLDTATLLKALGVSFPPSASASYLSASHTLIVRNTPENLHLIDGIVKGSLDPEGTLKERQALDNIIIPEIYLNNSTLEEAGEFLRLRSLGLDPAKKGVNINFLGDEKLPAKIISSLQLKNVPLTTVLRYLCDKTQTRLIIQGRNISILPEKR